MSRRKDLTQKVFTTRKPVYPKISSPKIIAAEREINSILNRKDVESTANPKNKSDVLVLFIHGFAASKYCWLDPDIGNMGWIKDYDNDPQPRDFGWHAIPPPLYIPVDWTMSKQLIPPGAHEFVQKLNVEWMTYSQKSAFGDIKVSVKELQNVMDAIKKVYGHRRIIIIAHSRGGLISKRYLDTTSTTDVEKLVLEVRQIKSQKYAIIHEEFEEGFSSIGVPVFNHNNQVAGALSILGPTFRIGPGSIEKLISPLKTISQNISRELGHGNSPNNHSNNTVS